MLIEGGLYERLVIGFVDEWMVFYILLFVFVYIGVKIVLYFFLMYVGIVGILF